MPGVSGVFPSAMPLRLFVDLHPTGHEIEGRKQVKKPYLFTVIK